jgi:tungstate transport system permease protein
MMVGGNIRFQTRVMTTAIALHKGMGEFQMALALGMILLVISLLINSVLDMLRRGRGAVN